MRLKDETKALEHIAKLIEKAGTCDDSADAMRFSQAACNAANTNASLFHTDNSAPVTAAA